MLFFLKISIKTTSGLVQCDFKYSAGPQYECLLKSTNMTSENETLHNQESIKDYRPLVTVVNNAVNMISFIPIGLFSFFYNVRQVNINSYGRFIEISENSFKGGSKIETMSVSISQISSIPAYAFSDCESLKVLQLVNSQISKVDSNAFTGAENLNYLSLESNHLTAFDIASSLPKLQVLNLRFNQITAIHPNVLSFLPILTRLDLSGNRCVSANIETNLGALESVAKLHLLSCFFTWNLMELSSSTTLRATTETGTKNEVYVC